MRYTQYSSGGAGVVSPGADAARDLGDADSFADEHEGDRLAYGEIDEAVVGT